MARGPKVTVLMSVYNGEKYLKEAIDSIFAQTFTDYEFLIINDGSTDRTQEILESYKDNRVRLFQQNNMGLTRSLNRGVQLSRGEYVARMDADDIALPERLENQVAFLEKHPEVGVVGSFHSEVNASLRKSIVKKFPAEDMAIKKTLIKENPFSHPTVMMRRKIFDRANLYNEDEKYKYVEDYELWFTFLKVCKFANIPKALVIKRFIPTGASIANDDVQLRNAFYLRVRAISEGCFPWWYRIYLIKPFIAYKTPMRLRRVIRKYLFSNKMYDLLSQS